MKRVLCIMAAVVLMSAAGCSSESEEEKKSELETVAANTSQETYDEAASGTAIESGTEMQSSAPVTTQNTTAQTQTDNNESIISTDTENVIQTDGVEEDLQSVVTDDAGENDSIISESNVMTDIEWLALGQEYYMQGCETAFRYLCTGSEFPFDRENLEIIDRTYFLTTCASFDEATAGYYDLFSKVYHASDFDDILLEQDGRLYAVRGARGMDITYLSSEVDSVASVSEEEVCFKVIVQYQEEEVTTDFSLVLDDDGVWRIGEFTLPY